MFKNFLAKSQQPEPVINEPSRTESAGNELSVAEHERIITEISDMMETLGFDTEHLLWIAKQNKEAFSTLVNNNQKIADSSAENLEQATFVEEKFSRSTRTARP